MSTPIQKNNPLSVLFKRLPAEVSRRRMKAVKAELKQIGKLGHFRQSVLRENWKMGDTHVSCAMVLIRELGLSETFFTAPPQADRLPEIEQLVRLAHQPLTLDSHGPIHPAN